MLCPCALPLPLPHVLPAPTALRRKLGYSLPVSPLAGRRCPCGSAVAPAGPPRPPGAAHISSTPTRTPFEHRRCAIQHHPTAADECIVDTDDRGSPNAVRILRSIGLPACGAGPQSPAHRSLVCSALLCLATARETGMGMGCCPSSTSQPISPSPLSLVDSFLLQITTTSVSTDSHEQPHWLPPVIAGPLARSASSRRLDSSSSQRKRPPWALFLSFRANKLAVFRTTIGSSPPFRKQKGQARFGGEAAGKSSTLIWTNELRGQGCTALGQYAFRGLVKHLQLDNSRRLVGPAGKGDGLPTSSEPDGTFGQTTAFSPANLYPPQDVPALMRPHTSYGTRLELFSSESTLYIDLRLAVGRMPDLDGAALRYRMQAPRNAFARDLQVITSSDNCSNVQNTRHRDIYDVVCRRYSPRSFSRAHLVAFASFDCLETTHCQLGSVCAHYGMEPLVAPITLKAGDARPGCQGLDQYNARPGHTLEILFGSTGEGDKSMADFFRPSLTHNGRGHDSLDDMTRTWGNAQDTAENGNRTQEMDRSPILVPVRCGADGSISFVNAMHFPTRATLSESLLVRGLDTAALRTSPAVPMDDGGLLLFVQRQPSPRVHSARDDSGMHGQSCSLRVPFIPVPQDSVITPDKDLGGTTRPSVLTSYAVESDQVVFRKKQTRPPRRDLHLRQ
ncbi:hypothetical protein CMUS01_03093 [Colletotrichum musicola]|uniref:Uncharacterized protein n=1 Tax=Colletotrichum musicola TaxID=2175873 RepID=A0A8H6NTV6_9PEZI|nr:hypothetical protein CMUS01_03093 [Colletotrichum musicola]